MKKTAFLTVDHAGHHRGADLGDDVHVLLLDAILARGSHGTLGWCRPRGACGRGTLGRALISRQSLSQSVQCAWPSSRRHVQLVRRLMSDSGQ